MMDVKNNKISRKKNGSAGFGITETLLSTVVLAVVATATVHWAYTSSGQLNLEIKKQSSSVLENNVLAIFNNNEAWKNTLKDPSNAVFNCLNLDSEGNSQDCYGRTGPLNIIRTAANSIYYDATNAEMGFHFNGRTCGDSYQIVAEGGPVESNDPETVNSVEEDLPAGGSGASAAAASSSCPYKLNLNISYVCKSPCTFPNIKVSGFLEPNPDYRNHSEGILKKIAVEAFLSPQDVECGLGCRDVEYLVDGDGRLNLSQPPAKILMMIDNSNSMGSAQANLGVGVGKMLDTLREKNVKIDLYMLTTTKYSYDKPYQFNNHYHRLTLPNGTIQTDFNQTAEDLCDNFPYYNCSEITDREIRGFVGDKVYRLEKDFTDDAYAAFRSELTNQVASVGVGGSSGEEGLCGMVISLFDKSENRIFEPGDKGGFIIISNEDDQGDDCRAQTKTVKTCAEDDSNFALEIDTASEPDYHSYEIEIDRVETRHDRTLAGTCTGTSTVTTINDGISSTEENVSQSSTFYFETQVAECSSIENNESTCKPSEIAQAQEICNSRELPELAVCYKKDCWTTTDSATCKLTGTGEESEVDLCSSTVSRGGEDFSNMAAYCQSQYPAAVLEDVCERHAIKKVPQCTETNVISTYFSESIGEEYGDMISTIHSQAARVLGSEGYFISAIIHDESANPEGCVPQFGESYGSKFRDLATRRPGLGSVASICSDDYSSSVNFAASRLLNTLNNSYVVPEVSNTEVIRSAYLSRSGVTSPLEIGTDVFYIDNTIQFRTGLLQPDDLVKFSIGTKYNPPVLVNTSQSYQTSGDDY